MTSPGDFDCDVVVVGAGIVGLAAARAVQEARPGAHVTVIDKESHVAAHQSGRNSGVIHSGIYYAPGSNKAAMVAEGRSMLLDLCERHGIVVDICGKVIVAARNGEVGRLQSLHARGEEHGLDVAWMTPSALREREPQANGVAALLVPGAGITDFAAVCLALDEEIVEGGGELLLQTDVQSITEDNDGVRLGTSDGPLTARTLINCAGLQSDRVARLAGRDPGARIMPFRGEYYDLKPASRSLVEHLIYPVPDPRFPFLGVHFTRTVAGVVHAGPNAVIALAREGYSWSDRDRADMREIVTARGTWAMARRYWRTGAGELMRSLSKAAFVRALQRLVPGVGEDDLVKGATGVRAQAIRPDGTLVDDFEFADGPRSVHVVNAPSPAATAALAIGQHIAERWQQLRA